VYVLLLNRRKNVCLMYIEVRHEILGLSFRLWLWAGQRRGRSSSPGRVKNFLHVVQTGSGAHSDSFPMGTGAISLGDKAARA
jgi:hypothetical protein